MPFAALLDWAQGCVYPSSVQTIAGQLQAKGLTWKGYEGMGINPVRDNGATCAHPAIGTPDTTQQASATDQYATRHNPFVYFTRLSTTRLAVRPATFRSAGYRAI